MNNYKAMKPIALIFLAGAFIFSATSPLVAQAGAVKGQTSKGINNLKPVIWGNLPDGNAVYAVELKNKNGVSARIISYGATLQSLVVPSARGGADDVVLGYDSLKDYLEHPQYTGVIVGRYANRINKGKFTLDGKSYQLATNNMGNSLHGGLKGFDKYNWQITEATAKSVKLHLDSKDMDEGYPGNLSVDVVYSLNDANELSIEYFATTDKPTIINLTNHSLFNICGVNSGHSALEAYLQLEADKYTPVDETLIPTGELKDVAGGPFDFRKPALVGKNTRMGNDAQIILGLGIDHNFVIRGGVTKTPKLAASLEDRLAGRKMQIYTTEPGIQMYTGNFLDGKIAGKNNVIMRMGDAVALEAQNFPDAPNQPNFPNAHLNPGETYHQLTIHKFSIIK